MDDFFYGAGRHNPPRLPAHPYFIHLARQALELQDSGLKAAVDFWLDQIALWRGRASRALGGDKLALKAMDVIDVDYDDVTGLLAYAVHRVNELTVELN